MTYYRDETGQFWTPVTVGAGETDYEYDYDGRLTKVTRVDGATTTEVEYKYDALARRVERVLTVNSVVQSTSKYIFDDEDVIAELDGSNNVVRLFVHGPGIDEPLAVKTGGSWYYYHADGLGSVINLSDSSGNQVPGYGYDSFGNLIIDYFGSSVTYTGREWDREAGLYYYRARFYDPETGRFISKDPIGFRGGDVNLYSYVGQNPVNWIDPSGHITTEGLTGTLLMGAGFVIASTGNLPVGCGVFVVGAALVIYDNTIGAANYINDTSGHLGETIVDDRIREIDEHTRTDE